MQELDHLFVEFDGQRDRLVVHGLAARRLDQLQIPVAVIAPEEVVDGQQRLVKPVTINRLVDRGDRLVQARHHPALHERQLLEAALAAIVPQGPSLVVGLHELAEDVEGVPDLVGEVAPHLELRGVELDVLPLRAEHRQRVAHGIGPVLIDHLQRVDAVAQALRHPPAVLVLDHAGDEHIPEGNLAREVNARHDHAGDPEEQDVVARDEHRGGIEVRQIGRLIGPAQRGKRPEPGRKPRVEHVFVLHHAGLGLLDRHHEAFRFVDLAVFVRVVPDRNAVAPPDLAADAPVADVFHPAEVLVGPPLRIEADLPPTYGLDGGLGQWLHPHEPLPGEHRLDDRLRAAGDGHRVAVGLHLFEQPLRPQVLDDALARFEAIQTRIRPTVFVDGAVRVHDIDDRQAVALADFEVVLVVAGRDLEGACAEVSLHVLVGNDRDFAPDERKPHLLADQVAVALVFGMHGHGRVAQHRLGARRGDRDVAAAVNERVADVPEVAVLLDVVHLLVRERGLVHRAPVDQVVAPIDESLIVKPDEGLLHGPREAFVHREARARPVAGVAQPTLLLQDNVAVLLLPLPDALQEGLTAQIVPRLTLFVAQLALDHVLRGNARVVDARQPERLVALHAPDTRQRILNRILQRMAHVKPPGYVGRRHHDHERRPVGSDLRPEKVVRLPVGIPAGLDLLRIVDLSHPLGLQQRLSCHNLGRFRRISAQRFLST